MRRRDFIGALFAVPLIKRLPFRRKRPQVFKNCTIYINGVKLKPMTLDDIVRTEAQWLEDLESKVPFQKVAEVHFKTTVLFPRDLYPDAKA